MEQLENDGAGFRSVGVLRQVAKFVHRLPAVLQSAVGAHAICPEARGAQQPLAHSLELVHVAAQRADVPSFTQTAPEQQALAEHDSFGWAHGVLVGAQIAAGPHAFLPEASVAQQPLTH